MTVETKYSIGEEVWTMYGNKPTVFIVGSIDIRVYTLPESWREEQSVRYNSKEQFSKKNDYGNYVSSIIVHETELFSSKQELLNSL